MRLAAVAVVPLTLCLMPAPNASADPDAYQIFDRAKEALLAQSYPEPIFFRLTVHVSEGDKDEFEHFHAAAFSSSDIRVRGVSDEEQAAPHESRGVNFKLVFSVGWNTGAGGQTATIAKDADRREASPDYLGVPLISPIYSFGLTPPRTDDRDSGAGDTSNLRTIATVTTSGRLYSIVLVGTDTIDGLYTYHLRLTPTSRPDRNRIRELWVDVYTYQIVRLQTQGNFTAAPMSNVPWVVTFQNIAGSIYIKEETALQPLVFRHDRTYSSASIAFDDIRATDDPTPILPTLDSENAINLREPEKRSRTTNGVLRGP